MLGFVCLGVGTVLLGQKAVFEYLKSCAVLYLNVVCKHCAVHLSPCLFAGYTVKCVLPLYGGHQRQIAYCLTKCPEACT